MLLARQQCPALMLEDQQVVRGRDLAAAIWSSSSRVGAGNSYNKRARALYRPGADWGHGVKLPKRCRGSLRLKTPKELAQSQRRDESTIDRLECKRYPLHPSVASEVNESRRRRT